MIILPEGTDVRTIKAEAICVERGITCSQLLGDKERFFRIVVQQCMTLPDVLLLTDPVLISDNFISPMVELIKNKGLIDVIAKH